MADGGPPASQPPAVPLVQPVVPLVPPTQLIVPLVQPGQVPQLNWSHFKPEFSGKPDEDAETHLLRMKDWMDMHAFEDSVKVQRFSAM